MSQAQTAKAKKGQTRRTAIKIIGLGAAFVVFEAFNFDFLGITDKLKGLGNPQQVTGPLETATSQTPSNGGLFGGIFGGGGGGGVAGTSTTPATTTTTTGTQTPTTPPTTVLGVDYVISGQDGNLTALSGTGLPTLTDTEMGTLILRTTGNGLKVMIQPSSGSGIYNVTNPNGAVIAGNNVELYGRPGTILKLGPNVNVRFIFVSGKSGVYIHDLEIDGNSANNSGTMCQGIGISNGALNTKVENCYIHDCRTNGISDTGAGGSQFLNNSIARCGANGITMGAPNGTASGNTVDGASDVGITIWQTDNCTIQNNVVKNINLSVSPFGENTHVGIMLENTGGGHTVKNNAVSGCTGAAFSTSTTGTGNVFDSNTISNCARALSIWGGGVTVTNSTFDLLAQNPPVKSGVQNGMVYVSAVGPVIITGCSFTNIGAYCILGTGGAPQPVVQLYVPTGFVSGTFSNNTVQTDGGKYTPIVSSAAWVVSGNTIQ